MKTSAASSAAYWAASVGSTRAGGGRPDSAGMGESSASASTSGGREGESGDGPATAADGDVVLAALCPSCARRRAPGCDSAAAVGRAGGGNPWEGAAGSAYSARGRSTSGCAPGASPPGCGCPTTPSPARGSRDGGFFCGCSSSRAPSAGCAAADACEGPPFAPVPVGR
ncbi:hypothetical protein BD310DRAFT_922718 [Dichomitus squalens]|uniref:Uncharacterized protein n=1 Tax=Dichomitus squalens TaxID=114155 RepID=A0A4Q9Q0A6_9APHY|nr:hypothetical protein BD310DRAFT_922718 [Dichomitus squalens]